MDISLISLGNKAKRWIVFLKRAKANFFRGKQACELLYLSLGIRYLSTSCVELYKNLIWSFIH